MKCQERARFCRGLEDRGGVLASVRQPVGLQATRIRGKIAVAVGPGFVERRQRGGGQRAPVGLVKRPEDGLGETVGKAVWCLFRPTVLVGIDQPESEQAGEGDLRLFAAESEARGSQCAPRRRDFEQGRRTKLLGFGLGQRITVAFEHHAFEEVGRDGLIWRLSGFGIVRDGIQRPSGGGGVGQDGADQQAMEPRITGRDRLGAVQQSRKGRRPFVLLLFFFPVRAR